MKLYKLLFILFACPTFLVGQNSTVINDSTKISIEGKDTFGFKYDSTKNFMNKWVYFDLDKPTKLKVILHMTVGIDCGTIATASLTIGTIETGDTIRVFELCNTKKKISENDIVVVTPAKKPGFGVIHPRAFVQNTYGQLLSGPFDLSVLKTTYGIIEKEKTTP